MTNEYGLDTEYFERKLSRMKDLGRFRPDEFARECIRMAVTADESVIRENEFKKFLNESPSESEVNVKHQALIEFAKEMNRKCSEASNGDYYRNDDEQFYYDCANEAEEYAASIINPTGE